jgi:putative transposase
MWKGKS